MWGGDVNYAAVCWLSSDVTTTDSLGITWIEFTLLGGEKVIFGQGVVADGTTVELPSGYAASQAFAVAYPHDQVDAGHIMFLVGAYVDSEMVVHLDTSDNTGHVWHGNASALVFAWQNNMGTVTTQNLNSETWMAVTLPNGKIFSVGCGKSLADGATFGVPSTAGDGSTLEVIPGSSDGSYESGAYHAQGVGACYLDTSDVVHITFNDGSGHSWTGQADVLAAFCVAGSDLSVIITVTPSSPSIGQSATVQFAASISGTANKSVTWSVDGVAAGNSTIGTINATGIYTAPLSAGVHTITAALVADTSVSGSATVTVTGAQSGVQFSIDSSASLEIFTGVQTVRVTGSGGSTA